MNKARKAEEKAREKTINQQRNAKASSIGGGGKRKPKD